MRLLVVEDDVKLARALDRGLGGEGYAVDVANCGDDALALAQAHEYDAVILDVMLPGIGGFSVCEALRRAALWMPVLMLTARAEVSERIRGLDAGADDYLVKPFDFGELLARLRALIRRGPSERPATVKVGDLLIEPSTRIVTRAGRQVELTAREFDLLEFLARHRGQVMSRTRLLEHVWGDGQELSNVVDVYVGYLRRKLEDPAHPTRRRLIRTVRGVGFLLETD